MTGFRRRRDPRAGARRGPTEGQNGAGRLVVDRAVRTTDRGSDGCILVHLGTGRICTVNAMGSAVWAHVEQGRCIAEIVHALVAEYDAPRARIQADVCTFIRRLVDTGFLADGIAPTGMGRPPEDARMRGHRP
jgi:hypothetical protein